MPGGVALRERCQLAAMTRPSNPPDDKKANLPCRPVCLPAQIRAYPFAPVNHTWWAHRVSRLTRLSPRRLVAICLVLTLGPLLALAYLSTTLATAALTREVRDRTTESATLSAAATQQQLLALLDTVTAFSDRPLVIDALKDGDPASFDLPELDRHLTYLTRNRPDIFRAFIVDRAGTITNSVPGDTSLVGHNFAFRDWYRGVRSSGQPYL